MKKLFALAATALFIMTSCSSDEATPTNPGTNPTDNVLLRKTIISDPMFGDMVGVYSYDSQNRLISVTDPTDDSGLYYTYEGNVITKMEVKNEEGDLITRYTYEYDSSGRLSVYKSYNPLNMVGSNTIKDVFVYNEDGTVSTVQYSGDQNSQPNVGASAVFTFSGGNIIKRVATTADHTITWTTNYTFDDKNTPEKNTTGLSALILADQEGGVNNIISADEDANMYTSTYTYNEAGYPITKTTVTNQGQSTTQYFYE